MYRIVVHVLGTGAALLEEEKGQFRPLLSLPCSLLTCGTIIAHGVL